MKKLVMLLVLVAFSVCFAKELSKKERLKVLETTDYRVLEVTKAGDIAISATNEFVKLNMNFDILGTSGTISMPIGRILITHTTPEYSIGTLVSRVDGYKPIITDIKAEMLCRLTSKDTLKAEKKIYKNQKKALKREYKLTKIKAKTKVYETVGKTAEDANEIGSIKAGLIKVEKK